MLEISSERRYYEFREIRQHRGRPMTSFTATAPCYFNANYSLVSVARNIHIYTKNKIL